MRNEITLTNGLILDINENHLGTKVVVFEKTRTQPLVTIGMSFGDVSRLDIGPLLIQLVTDPFTDVDLEACANLHIPTNLIENPPPLIGNTGGTGGSA